MREQMNNSAGILFHAKQLIISYIQQEGDGFYQGKNSRVCITNRRIRYKLLIKGF